MMILVHLKGRARSLIISWSLRQTRLSFELILSQGFANHSNGTNFQEEMQYLSDSLHKQTIELFKLQLNCLDTLN